MRRSILAFVALCAFLTTALALTPGQELLLFGGLRPAVYTNFTLGVLPSSLYSYSGPSLRTITDATGAITYAPNNLLTYSNQFSKVVWSAHATSVDNSTVAPDGSTTAATLTGYAADSNSGSSQYAGSAGAKFIASVWLRVPSGTLSLNLYNNGTAGVGGSKTVTVTTSWQQFFVVGTLPVAGSNGLQIGGGSTWGNGVVIYAWNATYSAVTYETTPRPGDQVVTQGAAYYGPAFDYDPITHAPLGLRVEESRTNYAAYGAGLSANPWSAVANGTVSTGNATGVDGTTSLTLLTAGAAQYGDIFRLNYSLTAYASMNWTASYVVKKNNWRYVGLRLPNFAATDGTGNLYTTFDFDTATWTYIAPGTTTQATDLGNGFWRLSVSAAVGAGTNSIFDIALAQNSTGNTGWTPSGTEKLWVQYAQFEQALFPSSIIPNATASQVTRAADVVQLQGAALASVLGSSMAAVAEVSVPQATQNITLSVSDGTTSNRVQLGGGTSGYIQGGGGGASLGTPANFAPNTPTRLGITAQANAAKFAYSGGNLATGNSTSSPATTQAQLGGYPTFSTLFLDGYIRKLALYNTALTGPQLQARTIVGAPF